MSLKPPAKNITIIIAIVSFALGALIYTYSKVIFQEGNPWPEIRAISQLTFDGSDMVKLSGSDNKYLTKSQGGPKTVDTFMKDRGYEYTDQMGSGYFYKSSDKTVVLTRRQYSRFYTIWTIGDVLSTSISESLADELKECLPKSDTASGERCGELLKQITDYDSCVNAGFSIMKSNPAQCATPDGRTFTENKK